MKSALLVLCLVSMPALAAPPTFDQLVTTLQLDKKAVDDLRAGKSYDRFPREVSERDLAAGIVFLSKKSAKDDAELFFKWADVTANPSVRMSHKLESEDDLATLTLGKKRDDECKRLHDSKPGEDLNLSTSEIAALHATDGSCDALEAALRKLLFARFVAYRDKGLAGIAPYARSGGKEVRGEEELGRVSRGFRAMAPYTQAFSDVLNGYPKKPEGARESFRFIVYDDDGRPRVALRHRLMVAYGDGNYGFCDREFYVSEGYNTTQGIVGAFAIDGGSLFVFRANTSTDRVEGSASSMKHSIGRKMMAKQFDVIFERFRDRLDK